MSEHKGKTNGLTEFFDDLREEDTGFADFTETYGPLANFLTDYEYLKGLRSLTQGKVADLVGTTQSAISRFEAMKGKPNYQFLHKISEALGDSLFLSPLGSMSVTLPYDLHEKARAGAEKRGIPVDELIKTYIREKLEQDNFKIIGNGTITFSGDANGAELGNNFTDVLSGRTDAVQTGSLPESGDLAG